MSCELVINADLTPILGPTLDQYLGPWFMEEQRFMQMAEFVQNLDLTAHIKQNTEPEPKQADEKPFLVIRNNIARIDIEGTMTKRGSSFGPPGTISIRRQLRAAMNDSDVAGILLRIDSPGGTAAGTKDLADDVFNATKKKPVMAFFEDTGASAAYYVGSQATVKRANASAVIGSIGTVLVVMDMSEFAKNQGIKVHVISTGPFKGAGVPGSEITEKHLAYFQDIVTQGNELFLRDVSRGTNLTLTQVRAVADGRVHMAAKAVELGLIDGIASMDEAVDELVSLTSPRRSVSMSDTNVPAAATLQELKVAFPGASSDFLVSQLDKGATLQQATTAFIAMQSTELEKAREEAKQAKEAEAEAKKQAEEAAKMPGNSGDESKPDAQTVVYENATAKWQQLIEEKVAAGMTRSKAAVRVDRENPGLREQRLKEWTPQPRRETAPA